MVIGEALCNVCPEPVIERLEAAVTLYCIALYCIVLYSIVLILYCAVLLALW